MDKHSDYIEAGENDRRYGKYKGILVAWNVSQRYAEHGDRQKRKHCPYSERACVAHEYFVVVLGMTEHIIIEEGYKCAESCGCHEREQIFACKKKHYAVENERDHAQS